MMMRMMINDVCIFAVASWSWGIGNYHVHCYVYNYCSMIMIMIARWHHDTMTVLEITMVRPFKEETTIKSSPGPWMPLLMMVFAITIVGCTPCQYRNHLLLWQVHLPGTVFIQVFPLRRIIIYHHEACHSLIVWPSIIKLLIVDRLISDKAFNHEYLLNRLNRQLLVVFH